MQVIETKQCTKCEQTLPLGSYYSGRAACKSCLVKQAGEHQKKNPEANKIKAAKWRKNNPEKYKQTWVAYRERNVLLMRQRCLDWRNANREYANNKSLEWAKSNPHKCAAQTAKRRAAIIKATPMWADLKAIEIEYELARWCSEQMGEQYHVDHIVPLLGKNVCGLHVQNNLQVIPASINISKSNTF